MVDPPFDSTLSTTRSQLDLRRLQRTPLGAPHAAATQFSEALGHDHGGVAHVALAEAWRGRSGGHRGDRCWSAVVTVLDEYQIMAHDKG